jgi:copper transport protein
MLALGLLFTAFLVLQPAPWAALPAAQAHATTVSTSPTHGSELDAAPAEIRVTFDEPVTLAGLTDPTSVIDANGDRVDAATGELDASRTTLTIPVRSGLPDGVYIASWRVVSADTHPVGGSLQFGVGVPAGMTPLAETPEPSAVLTLVIGVAKGAVYLGLVFALGVLPAALVLGAAPRSLRRVRRIAAAGALGALVASLAQLAAQFFWLRSGGGDGELLAELGQFLTTPYALAVWMRCGALALAAATIGFGKRWPGRLRLVLAGALGLVAVASVVVNGHGGTNALLFASTMLHAPPPGRGAVGAHPHLVGICRLVRRCGRRFGHRAGGRGGGHARRVGHHELRRALARQARPGRHRAVARVARVSLGRS